MNWCLFCFCFFYRFSVHLCTVPYVIFLCITCITCLFWLWICSVSSAPQVICGGSRPRWGLCKEECIHTQSNNHLLCSILRYLFGGIWLWWTSDGVVATNKSMYEETLAFTWCALKWKGTSLLLTHIFACIIYGLFFSLAAVESYFSFHLKCVWFDISVFVSAGSMPCAQISIRLISLLRFSFISIGLDFYFSLQMTFSIIRVNYDCIYSLWNGNFCSIENIFGVLFKQRHCISLLMALTEDVYDFQIISF